MKKERGTTVVTGWTPDFSFHAMGFDLNGALGPRRRHCRRRASRGKSIRCICQHFQTTGDNLTLSNIFNARQDECITHAQTVEGHDFDIYTGRTLGNSFPHPARSKSSSSPTFIQRANEKSRNISYRSIRMKSYCLSDISPSRTGNRSDRSPGCRLFYVTERYVPRIGYLKERVRT
jgi:hypothetical protein